MITLFALFETAFADMLIYPFKPHRVNDVGRFDDGGKYC